MIVSNHSDIESESDVLLYFHFDTEDDVRFVVDVSIRIRTCICVCIHICIIRGTSKNY